MVGAIKSDIVEEYEKIHYPIEKPSPAELIRDGLDDYPDGYCLLPENLFEYTRKAKMK